MRKIALLILLLLSLRASSQSLVQGTVKDANGEELPATLVQELGTENGIITDSEGKFILSTLQDTCQLVTVQISYIPETVTILKAFRMTGY